MNLSLAAKQWIALCVSTSFIALCAAQTPAKPGQSRNKAPVKTPLVAKAEPAKKANPIRKIEREGLSYSIAARPDWVADFDVAPAVNSFKSFWHYVENDEQILIDGRASQRYVGVVRQINDVAGLQAGVSIETQFDPTYQTLNVHAVEVLRNGQVINRLDDNTITLLRREQRLELAQIDGKVTASVLLGDVRVGDRIRYAYTIVGDNPVFDGRFNHFTVSKSPIAATSAWRLRTLHRSDRSIIFDTQAPVERNQRVLASGETETTFVRRDVPKFEFSPTEDPSAWLNEMLSVTEFASWAAVAQWGQALFAPRSGSDPSVAALARELTSESNTNEARIERLLDFVQREIRYLGVFLGESSHRPNPPATVLARRYGDCKDKTALFVALLAEVGIEASPVLVSQSHTKHVEKFSPMPYAFDHVIAAVKIGEKTYWLDPTRAYGSGTLDKRQAWRFKRGLPLFGSDLKIVNAPPRAEEDIDSLVHDKVTVEKFNEPALFTSTATFYGETAERIQAVLASGQGAPALASLFEFLDRRFADERVVQEATVVAEANGELVVRKSWRVSELFEISPQNQLFFGHGAWSHIPEFRAPQTTSTTHFLGADRRHRHAISLAFPERVVRTPKDFDTEVGDAHFSYKVAFRQTETTLDAFYLYRTNTDVVQKPEFARYSEKAREALSKAMLSLTISSIPFEHVPAFEQKIRDLSNSIDRGRLKPTTTVQTRAHFDNLALEEMLAHGRLTPKVRAHVLRNIAVNLDHLGQGADAKKRIVESLTLDPNSAETASSLAEIEFGLGNSAEAKRILNTQPAVKNSADSSHSYKLGRYSYQLGEFALAKDLFEKSVRSGSGAARDHALIWLVATMLRNSESITGLTTNFPIDRADTTWPKPILLFMLGESAEKSLLEKANDSKDESTKKSRLCEAYFFLGLKRFAEGNTREAQRAFERAVATGVSEYIEHRAAKFELAKIGR